MSKSKYSQRSDEEKEKEKSELIWRRSLRSHPRHYRSDKPLDNPVRRRRRALARARGMTWKAYRKFWKRNRLAATAEPAA